MSISDILTSDMITRVTAVSVTDMILAISLSFALGEFIFYIYKKTFRGVMYSSGFGLSLIGMCMISAILILAVSSNIVLSLGMVGALSIVRFRTAIKEPLDIVFLFWSISAGIILAAGMIPLAVFGSIAIGMMLLQASKNKEQETPFLLIVHAESTDCEAQIFDLIRKGTAHYLLKGKTIQNNGRLELTMEVSPRTFKDGQEPDSAFVKGISSVEGVENVVLVAYNGDYMN